MALNIFKKKNEDGTTEVVEEKIGIKKTTKKVEKKQEVVKPLVVEEKIVKSEVKKNKGAGGYGVLKAPHITEKATSLSGKNQYIFKVWSSVNKIEIQKAIKDLYKVDVDSVKIVNIPRRKTRLGKTLGWKQGYKKAIIRVKKGQTIEVLPR